MTEHDGDIHQLLAASSLGDETSQQIQARVPETLTASLHTRVAAEPPHIPPGSAELDYTGARLCGARCSAGMTWPDKGDGSSE